jgi:hypothetical protein
MAFIGTAAAHSKGLAMHAFSDADLQVAARRHVNRKLGFFMHLTVYLVINIGLMAVNLWRAPAFMWSFGPLFGWGIGLLFHGLAVYLRDPGATWKQRMIDNEIHRLKQNRH